MLIIPKLEAFKANEQITTSVKASSATLSSNGSNLDDLKSLFTSELNKLPALPYPIPAKIKPVKLTDFQSSPFIEKVLVDPYKTFELNKLSKAELSIDGVTDYLSGLLPPDLVSGLRANPELLNLLNTRGMSLEGALNGLSNRLPSSISLSGLIRQNGIMSIFSHLDDFLNIAASLGFNINDLSMPFLSDGLSFLSQMSSLFNTRNSFGNYFGFSNKKNNNYGMTSFALANINQLALAKKPLYGMLSESGVTSSKGLLPFLIKTNSNDFITLSAGTKIIGSDSTLILIDKINDNGIDNVKTNITTIKDTFTIIPNDNGTSIPDSILDLTEVFNTLGKDNTIVIKDITVPKPASTTIVANTITTYGKDVVNDINNTIQTNGLLTTKTIVETIVGLLATLSVINVLDVLAKVKQTTVAEYIATYGVGEYTGLLNLVTTYGINLVSILANVTAKVGNSNVVSIIDAINDLGNASIAEFIAMTTVSNTKIIAKSVQAIKDTIPNNFNTVLTQVNLLGKETVYSSSMLLNKLSEENRNGFIDSLSRVDLKQALVNVDNITSLSSNDITKLATQKSYYEPYSVLLKYGIQGKLLEYAIKKSCQLAANKGDYLMVNNLVDNYKGELSIEFKETLVNSLLKNYTIEYDNLLLGKDISSSLFTETLFKIYPNWNITKRNNTVVGLQTPFINSSPDAIELLLLHPDTAIAAILQKNNNYLI
jgi:hypothetical protein